MSRLKPLETAGSRCGLENRFGGFSSDEGSNPSPSVCRRSVRFGRRYARELQTATSSRRPGQRPSRGGGRPLFRGFVPPPVPPRLVSEDALAPRLSISAVHWGIASTLNSMSVWRRGWTRVSHARSLLVRRKEERAAGSIRDSSFFVRSKRSSEAGASATQPRRRSRLRR